MMHLDGMLCLGLRPGGGGGFGKGVSTVQPSMIVDAQAWSHFRTQLVTQLAQLTMSMVVGLRCRLEAM
jgi:hypothetical protein